MTRMTRTFQQPLSSIRPRRMPPRRLCILASAAMAAVTLASAPNDGRAARNNNYGFVWGWNGYMRTADLFKKCVGFSPVVDLSSEDQEAYEERFRTAWRQRQEEEGDRQCNPPDVGSAMIFVQQYFPTREAAMQARRDLIAKQNEREPGNIVSVWVLSF